MASPMEGMLKTLLGVDPAALQQNIEGMLFGIRDAILSTHKKIDALHQRLDAIEYRISAREDNAAPAAETFYAPAEPLKLNGKSHG